MSAVYGYLRASDADQLLDVQKTALEKAGCDRIWEEITHDPASDHPQLPDLLNHLQPGDTLIVWRLDRLGRSMTHLIETVNALQSRGVSVKSLTEKIDTSIPGAMIF